MGPGKLENRSLSGAGMTKNVNENAADSDQSGGTPLLNLK